MSGVFRFSTIWFAFAGVIIGLCALIGKESGPEYENLILSFIILQISVCLFFAFRIKDVSINRAEGCILLVILWVILPLPIGIFMMQSIGLSFVDAYFEATSALTTTGATILSSYENIPNSVLFIRGMTQWLGGLLTLMGVFSIMAPAGLGGLPKKNSAFINSENKNSQRTQRLASNKVILSYIALSAICFISLNISQVPIQDSFLLALATVSSGGFVFSDTPVSEIGNGFTPFALMIFMVLAGSSIIWQGYFLSWRKDLLKSHRETYFYFLAILGLGFVFSLTFFERAGSVSVLTPFEALVEGAFTAVSLISTTGFEIRNSSFSVLPATLMIMVVLIGGCSFSTAGGMSFYRLGAMLVHSLKDLKKLVYPNSVHRSSFGSQTFETGLAKSVWTYFFLVTMTIMLGTMFLALRLDTFEASLIASIAAFSNIGSFYATGWNETGQWVPFKDMDAESKFALCVLMTLGRLHIVALLIAFNRTYWQQSR
ncbi:MAG: potassium transporter TrkG [Hyphomicrobiales bacterium]